MVYSIFRMVAVFIVVISLYFSKDAYAANDMLKYMLYLCCAGFGFGLFEFIVIARSRSENDA